MTSVCVGAVASQPRAGIPDRIYLDTAFMSSILPPELVWMRPFLPYLPPIFIDVTAFCAAEPPSAPSLVEATMAAVLAGGEFGAGLVAAELILQVIQSQLWYQICECSSGTAPTRPTGQAAPSGLVQINPPVVVTAPQAGACDSHQSPPRTGANNATTIWMFDPQGLVTIANSVPVPAAATQVRFSYTSVSAGSAHTHIDLTFRTVNASGTNANPAFFLDKGPGTTGTQIVSLPANTVGFNVAMVLDVTGTTSTDIVTVLVEFFCGTSPAQPATPCCPPDPQLTGMITRILEYVTLLQRQTAPFAYVPGASHTALSGAGSIAIQGLIGAKVDVTTLPSSYGREGTSPTEYFDLGFLSFGTPDGWPSSYRLVHDPLLMFPRGCGLYTTLDYDIAPGVVVTVTELVREP